MAVIGVACNDVVKGSLIGSYPMTHGLPAK